LFPRFPNEDPIIVISEVTLADKRATDNQQRTGFGQQSNCQFPDREQSHYGAQLEPELWCGPSQVTLD
jgi:hypothetical protein